MSFKEDVEFYLGRQNKFDYYGFDIENDDIAEEDEEGGEEEASVKTKKKKNCPECGKEPCECSMKTSTHGEEDDDGWHASANTPPADFGATPEEIEMLRLIRKNGGLGGKFVPETPEEKEMLKLAAKIAASKTKPKASVDDKTAGYAPSCDTSCDTTSKKKKNELKEEILKNI